MAVCQLSLPNVSRNYHQKKTVIQGKYCRQL
uniref:Uncharacterized protein n=1 Tax=Felis catus TaxID=9685 RepID=A0ABI8A4X1_FELCA